MNKWTNDELMILQQSIKDNLTYKDITKLINRSYGTIAIKARELGLVRTYGKWEEDDEDQLRTLIESGLEHREIAKKLGRSLTSTQGKCFSLGLLTSKGKTRQQRNLLQKKDLSICSECKNIYPILEFRFTKANWWLCKTCDSNKGKARYRRDIETRLKIRLAGIRNRSQKKQLEYNLDISDLLDLWREQRGKCFYTDECMTFETTGYHSVSIDRKNSDKGYTKDNIVLCCSIINTMKTTLSIGEFKTWTQKIVDKNWSSSF